MNHRIVTGLLAILVGTAPASAETLATPTANLPIELAQSVTIGPNGVIIQRGGESERSDNRDRDRVRRDRYVCVVAPPRSSERNRPYVCNASSGRVGERCRCSGVTGNGRLDIDR